MIRVRQVKVSIDKKNQNQLLNKVAKKLMINENDIKNLNIIKESIDARDKNNITFNYEVDVEVKNEEDILKRYKSENIFKTPNMEYKFEKTGTKEILNRPIIIGSGPAGLMCAYILSENGYKPIIIERGKKVEERIHDVENFWENGKLNRESNVQFGEGGAGTFSDGKLNTLTKDTNNRRRKFLLTFVECGANEDILYSYKPHVGTDVLHDVIINLRQRIISNGGDFIYNAKFVDFHQKNGEIYEIILENKEIIKTNVLVLALGNAARDTFQMLKTNGINMESKPFAVGIRCEHLQSDIDKSQYGTYSEYLHPATYKLTHNTFKKRGVYSFCMCPGGYVINGSSQDNELVINGMSYNKRDSKNANSAIIVTVNEFDYGTDILDGIKYQEKLERDTFNYANGKIPIQRLIDFKNNIKTTSLGKITPCMKGKYEFANLNEILPNYISESIKEAFSSYGKKIAGFDDDDVILSAIETRSSSPIRIIRDENLETNIKGIFAIGEGSGYTGGITTSAVDGIKVAEIIGKIYK